jgi:hypothetical protein
VCTASIIKAIQSTRRYNPEDSHLHTHRRQNFKLRLFNLIMPNAMFFFLNVCRYRLRFQNETSILRFSKIFITADLTWFWCAKDTSCSLRDTTKSWLFESPRGYSVRNSAAVTSLFYLMVAIDKWQLEMEMKHGLFRKQRWLRDQSLVSERRIIRNSWGK